MQLKQSIKLNEWKLDFILKVYSFYFKKRIQKISWIFEYSWKWMYFSKGQGWFHANALGKQNYCFRKNFQINSN